jgi:hypothetical protein
MDYLHNAAQCIKLRTNQFMGNSQSAVMSTVRRENSNKPVSSGHRLTVAVLVPCLNEKPFSFLSFLSFTCGLSLDTVRRGRAESKGLSYLSFPVRFTSVKTIDP